MNMGLELSYVWKDQFEIILKCGDKNGFYKKVDIFWFASDIENLYMGLHKIEVGLK
jgi:hypothetical protein